MTSKTHFAIGALFIVLYVLTTFGVVAGVPEWVHQVCTVVFVVAFFLGLKKRSKRTWSNENGPRKRSQGKRTPFGERSI